MKLAAQDAHSGRASRSTGLILAKEELLLLLVLLVLLVGSDAKERRALARSKYNGG